MNVNYGTQEDVVALQGASLDFLLGKLRDLTLKNQELEAALQLANRRVAFYENFDDSIREAVAHALRVAFDIHERSEQQGRELLEDARREADRLRSEISALAAERDVLSVEHENLQHGVAGLRSRLQQAPIDAQPPSETARLLDEVVTLENRLKSIRDSLAPHLSPQQSSNPTYTVSEAPASPAIPVEQGAARPPFAPLSMTSLASDPTRPTAPPIATPTVEPAISYTPPPVDPAVQPQAQFPPTFEDFSNLPLPGESAQGQGLQPASTPPQSLYSAPSFEPSRSQIAPQTPGPSPVVQQPAAPSAPAERPLLAAPVGNQPIDQVELVFSPVHSFPKLVELERSLRTLPEVKSFYVRDFRYGVATLLVRLNSPEQRDDLPAKLEGLPGWNMVILSSPPNRIEAKIGA